MDWLWLLVPVVIFGLLWFIMHQSTSGVAHDDSRIAQDMRRQANVRNDEGFTP